MSTSGRSAKLWPVRSLRIGDRDGGDRNEGQDDDGDLEDEGNDDDDDEDDGH